MIDKADLILLSTKDIVPITPGDGMLFGQSIVIMTLSPEKQVPGHIYTARGMGYLHFV